MDAGDQGFVSPSPESNLPGYRTGSILLNRFASKLRVFQLARVSVVTAAAQIQSPTSCYKPRQGVMNRQPQP
jgi:hypothetical protein